MVTPRAQADIDIDGLAVFYETEGEGEGDTIVLLHGGLADNSTWAAQFAGISPYRRSSRQSVRPKDTRPTGPDLCRMRPWRSRRPHFSPHSASGRLISWVGATGEWWERCSPQTNPNSSGH